MLKGDAISAITCRTLRPKPISWFIISFSRWMSFKPFRPAIPVITPLWERAVPLGTIKVPSSSGLLVFLMLIGMPATFTGKIASS